MKILTYKKGGDIMKIEFKNIGCISRGEIEILQNCLNIKYGYNGLGKSTIAKAIYYNSQEPSNLSSLQGFGNHNPPEISISEECSAHYFDKNYADNYLFHESDLLNDSTNIIIKKTKNYNFHFGKVQSILSELIATVESHEINKFVTDISNMKSGFVMNKDNTLNATKAVGKGLKNGNFQKNIPESLEPYSKYILSAYNLKWKEWIKNGEENKYLSINHGICPFCFSEMSLIPTDLTKKHEEILDFFDNKSIKENLKGKELIYPLQSYNPEIDCKLDELLNSNGKKVDVNIEIKECIDLFVKETEKFVNLKKVLTIDYILDNPEKIDLYLEEQKMNVSLFEGVENKDLLTKVKLINEKIDNIKAKIEALKNELDGANKALAQKINKIKSFINSFLDIAGIPYCVDTDSKNGQFLTYLKSKKIADMRISDSKNTLSYGEKNAISLMLFWADIIDEKRKLIILDDPISSFDSNKKYAIIYQLFGDVENNFRGQTVLMLTHDFNTIMDYVYVKKPVQGNTIASFLFYENEEVKERKIKKSDLLNIIESSKKHGSDISLDVLFRIVHLRKLFELQEGLQSVGYNYLSSLLHLYEKPCTISKENIEKNKVDQFENELSKKYLINVNYKVFIDKYKEKDNILALYDECKSKYEKMLVCRFILENDKNFGLNFDKNSPLYKFLSERYHMENDYLFSLDPFVYDSIPDYLDDMCRQEIISKINKELVTV